jgi:starch synthase
MKRIFSQKQQPLKILFVSSECAPYVKIGGLGEVLNALPTALRKLGHDARVMIPLYASISQNDFPMNMLIEGLKVPSGRKDIDIICNVKTSDTTYFLENQEYYEKRGKVYGYDDDASRWALLCRASLELIKHSDWRPDVIVGSDWQGGLIANFMKTEYADDPIFSNIATVFSIHNLHFQGMFDHHFTNDLEYDDGQSDIPPIDDERMHKINFMRRGIRYADVINTVSQAYAQEITTHEFGEMLDRLLQERRSRLFGILNGIDYGKNNPETNPYIEFKYSAKHLEDRKPNKSALQKKFNLEEDEDVPIFAIVSRLAEQKGFDLLVDTMIPLLESFTFQLIVLGTGDSKYISFFSDLDSKYQQVATHLSFDSLLPHMIYAGADVILIPSRFEPSGLTQMEAMRYGALPLVRKTGGLADSVEQYIPEKNIGSGFVFEKYESHAFFGAFVQALETFKYKKEWIGLQKRAMDKIFSWDKSAMEYVDLFTKAIAFRKDKEKREDF